MTNKGVIAPLFLHSEIFKITMKGVITYGKYSKKRKKVLCNIS
mgnify:CR=1 FL=1|jgi:hypothetical protein